LVEYIHLRKLSGVGLWLHLGWGETRQEKKIRQKINDIASKPLCSTTSVENLAFTFASLQETGYYRPQGPHILGHVKKNPFFLHFTRKVAIAFSAALLDLA
jgi:hypothetical protein